MQELPVELKESAVAPPSPMLLQSSLDDFALVPLTNDVAFYFAGRLLQRLYWHWQQAVLLTGGICSAADLQEVGIERIIACELIERVRIEKAGFRDEASVLANRCYDLLISLVGYLPVNQEQVLKVRQSLSSIWTAEDQTEVFYAMARFYRDCTFAERRATANDYAQQISEKHVRPLVDQMQIALLDGCNGVHRNLFLAGRVVERGQCPDPVSRYVDDPTKFGSWVWQSQQGAINKEKAMGELGDAITEEDREWSNSGITSLIHEASLACVSVPIGALIPNDRWSDFQVAFEQVGCLSDQFQPIRSMCAKLRDHQFFDFLRSANQAVIEKYGLGPADPVKPHERAAVNYNELGLRMDLHGNLSRDSHNDPVPIPLGKARKYLRTLLYAGAKGASLQDFEPDLDEIERTERNRVQQFISNLRRLLAKLGIEIKLNRQSSRYYLLDSLATQQSAAS